MKQTLDDCISIRGRYHRSVSLSGDWTNSAALSEYVPTPTITELASNILKELSKSRGVRSWSITGPYGAGKSAFGLFLADCVASKRPTHQSAAGLRKRYNLGRPMLPVFVTAERAPLEPLIVTALNTVSPSRGSRHKAAGLIDHVAALTREVQKKRYGGIVLIIDELGKYLEYAALHPREADVFLLQQLAEFAARSTVPVLFLTILHSGLADYLPIGDDVRRQEWQKVQGRFRDVAFQLPADQVLELVAAAIKSDVPQATTRGWLTELKRVRDGVGFSGLPARAFTAGTLTRCFPLHPLTALLLWPVFRSKAAQNERSLFAFLSSEEPFGFREFLRAAPADASALFALPQLYDYLVTAFGLGISQGEQGRKWTVAEACLSKLPADAPAAAPLVLKAIALLSLYGPQVGLDASEDCLRATLDSSVPVHEVCEYLARASFIVFRRHSKAYALWEGSDYDLEAARENAAQRVGTGKSLAARLSAVLAPRPFVPRAHYIQSGTLRYLETVYVAANDAAIGSAIVEPTAADGKMVFVLPDGDTEPSSILEMCGRSSEAADVCIVGVAKDTSSVEAELHEYEVWRWISLYDQGLSGDPIARQEVRARLEESYSRLAVRIGPLLGLPGYPFSPSLCDWFFAGVRRDVTTGSSFQRLASDLVSKHFSATPKLRNELLNRGTLSSAASAARRTLIERMLIHAGLERLGIEGTPPEASMFESMLREGGFYKQVKGAWRFSAPTGSWSEAWTCATRFLETAKTVRKPLIELISLLKAPPLGLREGPIPVLLAALLIAKPDEVALYEEGVFVPELRIEVLERVMRRPETFELRSQDLDKVQTRVVKALQVAFNSDGETIERETLVSVVRSLVVFASRLNPYAKQTRRLQPQEAVRVRDLLLTAKDPVQLLFHDLPVACGIDSLSQAGVTLFVERLQMSLKAMGRAYPSLLDELETQLRNVFSLSSGSEVARRQLQSRAAVIFSLASDPKLQVFTRELARNADGRDWREGAGRAINGGLPPTHWKDSDISQFQVRLIELHSDFERLEELAAEQRKTGAPRVLRFGMLDGVNAEVRAVIPIRDGEDAEVDALVSKLCAILGDSGENSADYRRMQLEALGRVAAQLLVDNHNREAVL